MSLGNKLRLFMAMNAGLILAAILSISYFRTDHEKDLVDGLTFTCITDGQEIELRLWEDEETERYYLFLPSCFAGKNTEFI